MNTSSNPRSIKSRFTTIFLQSLINISRSHQASSSSSSYRRVRVAADESLALAVGLGRKWSRAMLWKIKTQKRRRLCMRKIARRRRRNIARKSSRKELEKLVVPGSEGLDMCSLLDETFHYITCLATQVEVMTSIALSCSV